MDHPFWKSYKERVRKRTRERDIHVYLEILLDGRSHSVTCLKQYSVNKIILRVNKKKSFLLYKEEKVKK